MSFGFYCFMIKTFFFKIYHSAAPIFPTEAGAAAARVGKTGVAQLAHPSWATTTPSPSLMLSQSPARRSGHSGMYIRLWVVS